MFKFGTLALGMAAGVSFPTTLSASVEAGIYVDPVAGDNGNTGASPAQAYETYAPLTAYDGTLPVFTKVGGVWKTSGVIQLTHDSHETISAGQAITHTSGILCGWVLGDGRVLLADSVGTSPGYDYATEEVWDIFLIIADIESVTDIALVGGGTPIYIEGPGGYPDITGYTNLEDFDVSLNDFNAESESPVGCDALTNYLIDRTGAIGDPPNVSGNEALEEYWLFINAFTGPLSALPPSIVVLRAEDCGLTGLPASINCPNTTIFRGYDNPLNEALPTSIVVSGDFNLADCGLTGTIPAGLAASTGLTAVDFNGNSFTGVATNTWRTQGILATLDLSFCGLTPTHLNVILADLVASLDVVGRVTCTVNIRQSSGSVAGQGLTDIATLQAAGWTILFF